MKLRFRLLTRIRSAYLFGTSLLVIMVISAYWLVDSRISNREKDAMVIETIAEQRMWSQRILLLATRLANPDTESGYIDSRAKLHEALSAMRENNTDILLALEEYKTQAIFPEIHALYFSGPAPLSMQLQDYLQEVLRVTALQDYREVSRELLPSSTLRQQARVLLQSYQVVVDTLVNRSRDKVVALQSLHKQLSFATVLLALGIVFFVFRPMEKTIMQERKNLHDLNKRLEDLAGQRALALLNTEMHAQGVLKTVVDGVITIDDRGIIQSFNPAATRLFGYSAQEAIGQNVKFLMPEPYHSEHDGYLERYAKSGEARIIGKGREVLGRRRDGTTFPMDLAVNPLEKGKGYVGLVHDISEHKRTESELRSVMAMRQAILDSANFSIIVTNTEGLISIFNIAAQRMLGYTRAEVAGKLTPAVMHLSEEVQARSVALTAELGRPIEPGFEVFVVKTREGIPDENEWTYVRKDGSTFPVSLSVTAMFDATGTITGYLGIGYDITERKRIERMKSEFISTVSHELRTPLTSIRGALGLVAGGATGDIPDKAKELVTIANNNCDRLVRLINDILDMEKIESGKMAFETKPVDIPDLITETVAANQAYAAQHQSKIVMDGVLPKVFVIGDRDRLIQALTNLISNAAKFTPPNTFVHVGLQQVTEQQVRLIVRDEGAGIPVEFQSRIFQKFSQADSSDTRQKGGTGLGLNITKVIVERHGGHISYETAENKGTSFFIDLPTLTLTPAAVISPHAGPRILIVEDDVDIAKLLRLMLEQKGYAADIANNFTEARVRLAATHYAAMTLDLLLPGESGISFLRELRSRPETVLLPVIVVSAIAEQGKLQLESPAMAVLDWLEKPIDERRLLTAVAQAVKNGPRKGQRILHVEDDPDIARIVAGMLEEITEIDLAGSLAEARKRLAEGQYSLVLLDIGLPDGSGLDLIPQINAITPPLPILVFSAQDLDQNKRASVAGAFVKSRTDEDSLIQAIRACLNESSTTNNAS